MWDGLGLSRLTGACGSEQAAFIQRTVSGPAKVGVSMLTGAVSLATHYQFTDYKRYILVFTLVQMK